MSARVDEQEELVHEIDSKGRQRHWMFKDAESGLWTCECGEQRDRFGKPVLTLRKR